MWRTVGVAKCRVGELSYFDELLLLTKEHTGTYFEFCQILIWFILSINFIMKGEFGITFKY